MSLLNFTDMGPVEKTSCIRLNLLLCLFIELRHSLDLAHLHYVARRV